MSCYGNDLQERNYNYLKNLDIEQLINVEITLDEVFDVFDGLIKARKVSVATGNQQAAERAPAVTTVITAQDIEAMGARDLDEVLETVPGLHVSRSNYAYRPIYVIRGMYTDYNPEVLVLINGIPITVLYSGNRGTWGGMSVNAISRIEVIRGPGSAVYGADALAGVINIFTKTTDDIKRNEVGVRLGRFNTYEGWILHGTDWNGFKIASSMEYNTTDGYDSIVEADAQTYHDRVFNTHASLAPGPVNMETDNLDARLDIKKGLWQARAGFQGRHHAGLAAGQAQALDPEGYTDTRRTNADLTYHNPTFTPYWDVTAQLSYFENVRKVHFVIYPPGAFGGAYPDGFIGQPNFVNRVLRLDTFAFYSGFPKHLFRIGAGYHDIDQPEVTHIVNFGINPATGQPLPRGSPLIDTSDTPYTFNREEKRKNQYLSLQDSWTLANEWELTAGVRYDDYSDFGSTTNPRLALVWQPQLHLTSKLLYGRAFRAPSFMEMYTMNNPSIKGNPNLKAEVIDTWEVAFDYRIKENLHLSTNLFHYKATDKIQMVAASGTVAALYQNIGVLEGNGLELEARWKMSARSSLLANYSYAKVANKGNGHDLGNYPRHLAYIRTDWLLMPDWYLDVQANWVANRQRTLGDPRSPIADDTTVDLTLRYKDIHDGRMNFALSIRNLLNADAREPSLGPDAKGMISIPNDLPLAGRSFFVEFRYQF